MGINMTCRIGRWEISHIPDSGDNNFRGQPGTDLGLSFFILCPCSKKCPSLNDMENNPTNQQDLTRKFIQIEGIFFKENIAAIFR